MRERPGDSPSLSTQIDQIVAFLQGLNTIQNIDVARRELKELLAKQGNPRREQDTRLQTAFDETQDGIDVLDDSGLYPTAKTKLIEARNFISQAQAAPPGQRRPLIQQAIAKLDAAQERRRDHYAVAHGAGINATGLKVSATSLWRRPSGRRKARCRRR